MPIAGNWDGIASMLGMSGMSICIMDGELANLDLSDPSVDLDSMTISSDCDVYLSPDAALEMGISAENSISILSEGSASMPSGPVTITYAYDKLNRLTEANYSNDDYYHYTYDAVGNRLTQESRVNGLSTYDAYQYDYANRLRFANDTEYVWDANGNLLNDGVNNYGYDLANRLVSFSNPTTTATYRYNGLGDRLEETVNGTTTTFTMDLNAGLTQALSDGANTYNYGIDRLAQTQGGLTEYFLGDALGSVRQMTNANAEITHARAYDPYGVVAGTVGSSQTSYAYTGEYYDSYNELLYPRARYYASYPK